MWVTLGRICSTRTTGLQADEVDDAVEKGFASADPVLRIVVAHQMVQRESLNKVAVRLSEACTMMCA